MEQTFDIAVVGAGVVGVACATRLQLAGYRVLLIDRDQPGAGCSRGNAGHFATEQVLPLASPGLLPKIPRMLLDPLGPVAIRPAYLPRITPWLLRFLWQARPSAVQHATQALSALNHAALAAWERLLSQTGSEQHLQREGSLLVFETEAAWRGYQPTLQALKANRVSTQVLSGEQVRDLEPRLSQTLLQGVLFPDTGHTADPYALTLSLVSAFLRAGGHLQQDEVVDLSVSDQACEIRTQRDLYHSEQLLIATGAWSGQWLKTLLGTRIPLDTERGYHLMLPEQKGALSMPVSSAERKFIMTPMQSGLRCAGTVEFGGLSLAPDMRRADMLARHAAALLPELPLAPGERWMGHRPSLPDSLPVIDRCGPGRRLLLAFGHQHLGLTQAAITAELVEALLLEQPPALSVQPYALSRFA